MSIGLTIGLPLKCLCKGAEAGGADGEYSFAVGYYEMELAGDPPTTYDLYGLCKQPQDFGVGTIEQDFGTLTPSTFNSVELTYLARDFQGYILLRTAGNIQIPGVTDITITVDGNSENLQWAAPWSEYVTAATTGTLRTALENASGTTVTATITDIT